jgi:hypothetical protein
MLLITDYSKTYLLNKGCTTTVVDIALEKVLISYITLFLILFRFITKLFCISRCWRSYLSDLEMRTFGVSNNIRSMIFHFIRLDLNFFEKNFSIFLDQLFFFNQ